MTILKNKVIAGGIFVKTKVQENKLRTVALFCMILVLGSFFLPFMSAKADVSLTGVMDNTVNVITPQNDILTLNLGDFVLQKPIDNIKVFNIPLGEVKIFNQSLLTILRNPIPDKGIISNIDQTLSSSALNFLIDPKIHEVISTKLAMGDQINIILTDTYNILQEAKSVVGAVNNVTIQARDSMAQVNAAMATMDGYKTTANIIVFLLFTLGLAMIFLLLYKRAPVAIAIGLSSFLFLIFAGVGIGVTAANNQINAQLAALTAQINNGIVENLRSILTETLGDMGNFIANFIATRGNFLYMNFYIQLEVGYWLILLGLGGTLILTILVARQNKKNKSPEQTEIDEAKSDEIIAVTEIEEIKSDEIEDKDARNTKA
ncbi:hypothetical protein [Acetobacterium sp.]|uniref:hypothetical protein n=1 Tax=Acetobacterium sp. TaxID=1872094 RepID=UPI002F3F90B7